MKTLSADGVTDNVRKLANIISKHLNQLTPLGTAQGKRAQKIVELAKQEMNTVSADISIESNFQQTDYKKVTRLKELKVGPFSGFAKEEIFDLDSQIVLIYGPNGTGKSSFCEALEYGLLGSVLEAESKRFTKAEDYLKNAHTRRFSPPVIYTKTSDSNSQPISANEALFRFCFVEKNRIDNFSRIAAHAPARQTELISTLFGLDVFNDFVKGFTASLDSKYIDLVGIKKTELNSKKITIEGDKQTIDTNTAALESLAEEEQALADSYQKDIKFTDFVIALGTSEQPGEIQRLEGEQEKPAPVISGLKSTDLKESREKLEGVVTNLLTKEDELAKCSEGLSYKKLYQAVIELTSVSKESCPACETPLSNAKENPFQRAEKGLTELEHLNNLEQERDTLRTEQQVALKEIYEKLKKVCETLQSQTDQTATTYLQNFLVSSETLLNTSWWSRLIQGDDKNISGWTILEEHIQALELKDADISQALQAREKQKESLKGLRALSDKAIALISRRTTLEEAVAKANNAIADFEETNKTLIENVEKEEITVRQNKEIAEAYSTFIELISEYRLTLPGQLLADLGDRTVELYNAFNRSDANGDLLAKLRLPTTSGERIEISFKSNPDSYFDALHVLSEGHIRCVGLAILLAKNLKEECPLLIFDDPVNAIDDDHREAIRRSLFEDEHFKNKQIILTCHGEEFFKDIQNLLGAEVVKTSKRYTFLPQSGDKHIQIDFQSSPRNYVLAAQEHLKKLECRDALAAARRALEVLTNKVWHYVSKHGDGNLSIKLRSSKAPIELRNLAEQLKSRLSQKEFIHVGKDSIQKPINKLLGLDGDSREWRYLNKGTHDESDKAEFDRVAIGEIVTSLAELDNALVTLGKA